MQVRPYGGLCNGYGFLVYGGLNLLDVIHYVQSSSGPELSYVRGVNAGVNG